MALIATVGGLALEADAKANGTNIQITNFTIGTGQYTPTGTETDIRTQFSPRKQYSDIGVKREGATTDFTTIIPDNNDAFNIGEVGVWVGSTLYAIESQPVGSGWLATKVASQSLIMTARITDARNTAAITSTGTFAINPATESIAGIVELATAAEIASRTGSGVVTSSKLPPDPDASNTVKGKVELATDGEATEGTDTTRALTPASGKALVESYNNKSVISTTGQASGSFTDGVEKDIVTLAITPSRTTSMIGLWFKAQFTGARNGRWRLYRGSTVILFDDISSTSGDVPIVLNDIDTPGTTSSVTYKVTFSLTGGSALGGGTVGDQVLIAIQLT